MASIHGKLAAISGPNKNGFYGIKLDDSDVWYGYGKFRPKAGKGDTVLFDAEQNDGGFWNIKTKTFQVKSQSEQPASQEAGVQSAPRGATNTDDRQYSIIYQTCLKAAAEVTAAMIAAGRYNKNLTDAEVDDEVVARTNRFYEAAKNLGNKPKPKTVSKAKPEPEAEEFEDDSLPF